jgi:hypothetical protein
VRVQELRIVSGAAYTVKVSSKMVSSLPLRHIAPRPLEPYRYVLARSVLELLLILYSQMEAREMIFQLSLADTWTDWNRKTPSLLVALRGQKELYFQALEVFLRTNSFHLTDCNILKFKAMPEKVLSNIRALHITSVHNVTLLPSKPGNITD